MRIIIQRGQLRYSEDQQKTSPLGAVQCEFKSDGIMVVRETSTAQPTAEVKCSLQQFAQAVHHAVERNRPKRQQAVSDDQKEAVRDRLLSILEFAQSATCAEGVELDLYMPKSALCPIDVTIPGLRAATEFAERRGDECRKMAVMGLIL